MNEVSHFPNTVDGLIKAYVAARVAQFKRINKAVMDQYDIDVKHYKEGADMTRPVEPSVIIIREDDIKRAFSEYETKLLDYVKGEGPEPTVKDEIELAAVTDALEGYERDEEPVELATGGNGDAGAKKGKGKKAK